MAEFMAFKNRTLEQRSFRLRVKVDDEKIPVREGFLVVVPGRDPVSGEFGVSNPVPIEFIEAEAEEPWFMKFFEEGILEYAKVA